VLGDGEHDGPARLAGRRQRHGGPARGSVDRRADELESARPLAAEALQEGGEVTDGPRRADGGNIDAVPHTHDELVDECGGGSPDDPPRWCKASTLVSAAQAARRHCSAAVGLDASIAAARPPEPAFGWSRSQRVASRAMIVHARPYRRKTLSDSLKGCTSPWWRSAIRSSSFRTRDMSSAAKAETHETTTLSTAQYVTARKLE
jgi:hypothetical protein